ncbi:phosphoribosylglycinamide synthetase C domain-containing protein [Anaerolineales bacterium HSG25]|nr:phosphoribosylglycinamide synthetase C domain-containing protein [Anaerolineales bacterium HSG25]
MVMASGGYPGKYETGKPIQGIETANQSEGVTVFHAGTKRTSQGQILTAGGRVLNVTGVAGDFREALQRAYAGIEQIQFEGAHYRTDIGAKAL